MLKEAGPVRTSRGARGDIARGDWAATGKTMTTEDRVQRRAEAAAEFDAHERRTDGVRVAENLAGGLNTLRDALFVRIQADVEQRFGMDSMLSPMSLIKSERMTKAEIDLYQIVESAATVRSRHLVSTDDDWYLGWLGRLRLGESQSIPAVVERIALYRSKSDDDRRRAFSVVLERTLPEAKRAPLVLYRLLPLAVSIVTSIALGDHRSAEDARRRQVALLPVIADCQHCRGRLLETGEVCQQCGNPMWKHEWLTAD